LRKPHLRLTARISLILVRIGIAVVVVVLLASWGDIPDRNAPPPEVADNLHFPGIPKAWMWGDDSPPIAERWQRATKDQMREKYPGVVGVEHNYLAISGGADNGAYGAGLLYGWSESGSRPDFTLVTGISTGALAAPFAFLGSRYDDQLKEMYTTYGTVELIEQRTILEAITSDAFTSTESLLELIQKYMTQEVLDAIGVEYRKGRILLIGTTNLDASRPVLWRIGRIAISDSPDRLELFHDVLLASASIPVAFPPVYIKAVGPDGNFYDEMHVDGGVTTQIFLYPIGINWGEVLEKMSVSSKPDLYVIRNDRMEPLRSAINPGTLLEIGRRTLISLIRTQGIGDIYRLYLGAVRDGLRFHIASIPSDFEVTSTELFDPVYMGKLFELGRQSAKDGYPWSLDPPGYKVHNK